MSMPSLRPSQVEGVRHILTRRASFLLWQMGSGKTRTVLTALHRERLIGGPVPIVVVAPKRVAVTQRVWEEDAARWEIPLTFSLVHGSTRAMAAAGAVEADVFVCTYDVCHRPEVQSVMARVAAAGGWLVLDESTYVKSFGTRFKSLRAHAKDFSRVILLTGTPVPNGMRDLFYQVQLLDDGAAWGMNKQTWLNTRFHATDYHGYRLVPNDPESLYRDIERFVHRVDSAGLPPVVVQRIDVEMTTEQRGLYDDMLREYLAVARGTEVIAGSAAIRVNKLRQICAGFLYPEGGGEAVRFSSERASALRKLVAELGQAVIVVYEFKADLEAILSEFPGARTLDSAGAIDAWNRGEVEVLVMHPKSGGHGLNLQHGGHHVIWYMLPWSLELWNQTNARLARPGQREGAVFAHVMAAAGSVEGRVYSTICEKQMVEQRLLDYF